MRTSKQNLAQVCPYPFLNAQSDRAYAQLCVCSVALSLRTGALAGHALLSRGTRVAGQPPNAQSTRGDERPYRGPSAPAKQLDEQLDRVMGGRKAAPVSPQGGLELRWSSRGTTPPRQRAHRHRCPGRGQRRRAPHATQQASGNLLVRRLMASSGRAGPEFSKGSGPFHYSRCARWGSPVRSGGRWAQHQDQPRQPRLPSRPQVAGD